jgi:hypothetical protein
VDGAGVPELDVLGDVGRGDLDRLGRHGRVLAGPGDLLDDQAPVLAGVDDAVLGSVGDADAVVVASARDDVADAAGVAVPSQ